MSKQARQERLAREWERRVEEVKKSNRVTAVEPTRPIPNDRAMVPNAPQPREIEKAKEEILASVQHPHPGVTGAAEGLLWWTGGNIEDYIPLSEYGTRQRQVDLRYFSLLAPMCLNATSVLTKKCQALQWSVEAGRNKALKWQDTLNNLEEGKGWGVFIGKWVRAYSESDFGGYAEIIRRVPSRYTKDGMFTEAGKKALQEGKDKFWPITNARVMDAIQCVPTNNTVFPLIYTNPYSGDKFYMREYQFMRILDMPDSSDRKPNQGLCGVSRAVWAAQEDRMVTRYGYESISENPGTGMVLANINQTLLETALKSAKDERSARGVTYYKGMIFLPMYDPSGNVKLEYLTFAHLPENFNRTEDYSRIKEIVATAFGLDVLELGSIPGHNLGTAQQAVVAAEKARGKGIGALVQDIERAFYFKFLPRDVQLQIKKHDTQELLGKAELDKFYFDAAVSMVTSMIWTPEMANQYLADKNAILPEGPYLFVDQTPSEEFDDTEAVKSRQSRVRVWNDGRIEQMFESTPTVDVRKALEKLRPEPGGDLPELSERITEKDRQRAKVLFAQMFPRYAELLDAGRRGA